MVVFSKRANQQFSKKNLNFNENDFSKCDLSSTKFISCDLTSCNFSESNLTSVDYTGSIITNVNFGKAIITNADFSNTTGTPVPTSHDSHPIGLPLMKITCNFCGRHAYSVKIQIGSGSAAFKCHCNNYSQCYSY